MTLMKPNNSLVYTRVHIQSLSFFLTSVRNVLKAFVLQELIITHTHTHTYIYIYTIYKSIYTIFVYIYIYIHTRGLKSLT